jgi:hypothetical protein
MNYNDLKTYAESNNFEIQQIANELGMTPNGFREAIRNETIQLKKLRMLCKLLQLNLNDFDSETKRTGLNISNVHLQAGNNNKIIIENKDREIELLKQSLADKDEIIKLLREKQNKSGYLMASAPNQ